VGAAPKRLAEVAGLPDWPLLLTGGAAAAYLNLTVVEFTLRVGQGELPPPRRTPGGERWSRRDLDAWFAGPAARENAQDALHAVIDAWSRP
jgi:hypothetical protein